MSKPDQFDVLVLGLGPAGACAAAAAARAGARILAIDRKEKAGLPVQCAEFVPGLIGQEVRDVARATRQPITAMVTFVEDEAPDVTPDFRGNMISRAAFDQSLVEDAVEAGAVCHFSATVRHIAADGTVTLADGRHLGARVIVGADGPHSLAGRAIGQMNTALVETRQVNVPLLRSHAATDIFLSSDMPGGYGWLFPRNDVANLGLGVAPAWRKKLKPLLAALHRTLITQGRVGKDILAITGGAIPVGGLVDPVGDLGHTKVLLAGDAAGLANPITGAGISAAVASGKLAGQAAAGHAAGNARAVADYCEELEDTFGAALQRAVKRRQHLMGSYENGGKAAAGDLRATWIAFPDYWAA